jgi:hypothetical protein
LSVFGLELGELYLGGEDPERVAAIPAAGAVQSWVLGARASTALTAAQRFKVGQQAMALRLGVLPLVIGRTLKESLMLFRAGALAAEMPFDAGAEANELAGVARPLGKAMARKTRKALQALLPPVLPDELGLASYLKAVSQSCMRAGLLVGGELGPAVATVLGSEINRDTVIKSDAALDLAALWISSDILALRREMGMAL